MLAHGRDVINDKNVELSVTCQLATSQCLTFDELYSGMTVASALTPVPCESNADLDKHGRSTDGENGR